MQYTSNYNLNLAEGTDIVNPMSVDNPNYQTIDLTMYANEQAGVGTATELKTGTVHALTRVVQSRNVFKFKSTSIYNAGDTFTVDGSSVTALYPDNSSLKERCFIVGSEVLCMLDGTQLTVLASYYPEADKVTFDNTGTGLSSTDVQNAIEELTDANKISYDSGNTVKVIIDKLKDLVKVKELSHTVSSITGYGATHWNPHDDSNFDQIGYTPIGIIGYITNSTSIVPFHLGIANDTWQMGFRNVDPGTISNITITYKVLYVRTTF